MTDDKELLSEPLLSADQFCSRVEGVMADYAANLEKEELGLKVAQCRNFIDRLQEAFIEDKLDVENASIRADFR